jgi:hypothetical protein
LLRLANKAKSLVEIYKQASTVIPVALPQHLPRSVALDASSKWQTSALMATALETATLASRLRDRANRDTLGNMGDLLNSMGKQSLVGLQMSFQQAPTDDSNATDPRQPGGDEGEGSEGVRLDMSFSPADRLESGPRQRNGYHQPRVFSQAVTWRGAGEDSSGTDLQVEDQEERNRYRSAYEPATRKYCPPPKVTIEMEHSRLHGTFL